VGPGGRQRFQFGAYAQDQWTDVVKGLDLLAGIRLDYFNDFGLAFNPRVGVVYGPIPELRLKLLYSMSFRAPTFQELYDDSTFDPYKIVQGNNSLDAITINTLEAGVEARIETHGVEFRLRGNFFYNWIRDSIESIDTAQGFQVFKNFESLDIFGTEVEAVMHFSKRNRLYANSSWFRGKVQSNLQAEASYLTDTPQLMFNAGLDLAVFEWLNVHLGFKWVSERRNNTRRQLEMLRPFKLPAQAVVQVGLLTEPVLLDHLAFFAFAYNVFDADVRDPVPRPDYLPDLVPRAPLSFMAGVAWQP
jgi:outer membrane receptor protein involved in Fe transport